MTTVQKITIKKKTKKRQDFGTGFSEIMKMIEASTVMPELKAISLPFIPMIWIVQKRQEKL